jgi:hypothetical protein
MMDVIPKFPDHQEESRRRAEAFQQLTPAERWQEMGALFSFGWRMVNDSPHREEILKRMEENELHWRKIQEELITRHGR